MKYIMALITSLFLVGCASNAPVNEDRAGCTYINGKARTGTLTQYAKGASKSAHIYVGKEVNSKHVKITCNADTQEVTWGK